MSKKTIEQFLSDAKNRDSYWLERTKLDFSLALERERRHVGLSYADLAKRLGTSPAYISKVFRGDTNLTIESMVKLVRAVGGKLHIEIASQDHSARWVRIIPGVAAAAIDASARRGKEFFSEARQVTNSPERYAIPDHA